MEPRNEETRGSRRCHSNARPRRGAAIGLASAVPPGSENRARSPRGSPGTWEAPPSSRQTPGGRYRVTNSRPMADASGGHGSETRMRPGYRPREGNEARRDGWRGVGASNSTFEAGEPTLGTPWREGGAGPGDRRRDRCRGHRAPTPSQQDDSG